MATFLKSFDRPIKVVFLTFYFEAWDALAQVYEQMTGDERFETTVISIPRRFTKDSPFAEEDRVSAFLDEAGVPHKRFNFANSFEGLAELQKLAPDYVFINYPWQRNYQPGYRVEALAEFTKVCYIPYYSLPLVNEPGEDGVAPHIYSQRSHQLASLIFTQDSNVLEALGKTSRGNSHVHLTGSPKLDELRDSVLRGEARWPLMNSGNLRLVWATHHSFSPAWLNFGLFDQYCSRMLEFARTHQTIDFVLRPHPLMFTALVNREIFSQAEVDQWLADWNSLPNTAIDSDGDVAELFAAADVLVTDGISFLGEYPLATEKPGIFTEKAGHWSFSPLGELAANANLKVHSFDELVEAISKAQDSGLPDYSNRISALSKASQPHPGKAASLIVEAVAEDFLAQTPLVNKDLITEVAWENAPGTEPAWD